MTTEHGTISMYCNNGCRCDLCRDAQRQYMRRYRATSRGRIKTQRSSRVKIRVAWECLRYVRDNHSDVYFRILDEQAARG